MKKIEYVKIEVRDLSHAVQFYSDTFHMRIVATYQDKEKTSCLLQYGSIKLIFSGRNNVDSAKNNKTNRDYIVNEIAFLTEDVEAKFNQAVKCGQEAVIHPFNFDSKDDHLCMATVSGMGNIKHTFIQRKNKNSNSLPHFQIINDIEWLSLPEFSLREIDHVAICVPQGELDKWVNLYETIYDFKQTYEEYVSTEKSGMNSKVVESKNSLIKIVLLEPIPEKTQSQITDYLNYYGGPCVQHVAFSTSNILATVKTLRKNGVEFLSIPDKYYEIQKLKLNLNQGTLELLRSFSILIDKHESGYLYQIFTKPIESKPTLFFELIQRNDCSGFGSGNIKALFQAIEQEQAKYVVN